MNKTAVKASRTAMYAAIAKTKSATQRLKIICSMPLSRNILWDFHGVLLKEIDHDQDMFKKQREALKRIMEKYPCITALGRVHASPASPYPKRRRKQGGAGGAGHRDMMQAMMRQLSS